MHLPSLTCKIPLKWHQFSSVTQLCLTLCDPMDCSTQASLSITNSWSSLTPTSMSWWRHPTISSWESQFLGGLIRSSGSPRRRKGSGAPKVEIGALEFSRRRKGQTFCPLHSLVLVNYTTQFKLCTRDYTTTMYLAAGQFLLPENLLTNPDILECILWEWV